MKHLLIAFATMFALSFTSCGNATNNNETNDSDTVMVDTVVVDSVVADSVK